MLSNWKQLFSLFTVNTQGIETSDYCKFGYVGKTF